MAAPVPLSSGCCSTPCPTSPITAVPGPQGENAFSFTTIPFTQPAAGANTIPLPLTHDGWVVVGQTVFVQGGGFYQVASVSGLSVTLTNTGNTGNAVPGTLIGANAKVSPGGVGGNIGNAFTTTTANFNQPAVNAQTGSVSVVTTNFMTTTEVLYVTTGGYYTVFSVIDGTHVNLTNLGYPGNAAPASVINSGATVTPGGLQGAPGATGISTLNGVSPTTTKGDLIVDNGSNNPLASDVRLAAGTNGQLLASDSAQPSGLGWKTVLPNSVSTSGDIAIFNGTSGLPNPIQDSKLLITADGAIQSTPTGGNARGSKAVDLQVDRVANTQVSSGADAVIAGGQNNTASAANSTVGGGLTNLASQTASTVAGGQSNTASGINGTVVGGTTNIASGGASIAGGAASTASATNAIALGGANTANANQASAVGGQSNTASAPYASCHGGHVNTASGQGSVVSGQQAAAYLYGQRAHGSGQFATQADAQISDLIWRMTTGDATANVEMFLDGPFGGSSRAVVPNNTTWAFILHLIGRSDAGVCAMWEAKGAIQNNANTVTLVASPVTPVVIADGTGATWGVAASFSVTADNVNKSLKLAVTGAAVTNIRWVASAGLTEVQF